MVRLNGNEMRQKLKQHLGEVIKNGKEKKTGVEMRKNGKVS